MRNVLGLAALIGVFSLSQSYGDESKELKKNVKESSRDVARGVKHTGRDIKDKTCELFNGKAECAVKEGINSVKNGTDKVEDAVE